MKRVVDFQEDTQNNEWEFKNAEKPTKRQKNHKKKEKFNAGSQKRLSHTEFAQKKREMLDFRKQLPIYSGMVCI
jgi:dolichyl-phosphate-mannose--protein O-mannosyl transferase